ncbi:MAG: helix-turn-helix domain-containing protein [Christensenellaceae bacterium]|nr:helix-turn-helix domain-containing protein [Christensenellaceae bacterium]
MQNTFIKNLKRTMAENEINQTGLTEMLGMAQSRVSNWLNGKSVPTITSLVRLCKKLKIDSKIYFVKKMKVVWRILFRFEK